MALKTDPISSIQPFWHIDCPVCGGEDFTQLGVAGGVWCDQCNAEFRVRGTSGDPGCVVDCFIGEVHNIQHRSGDKHAWRKALTDLGCYTEHTRDGRQPKVYAYRIMKEPGYTGTYCTDDRKWILSIHGRVLDADLPIVLVASKESRASASGGVTRYRHLTEPLVSYESAAAWGEQIN
jgi:hypothetical protein